MSHARGRTRGEQVASIGEADIHDVLRNDRRRMVLEQLGESDTSVTARELSETIAARESGSDPPPRDVRRSVYISLQQTHLPKLDDLDVIDYDEADREVRPGANAAEVGVYMEVVPRYGLTFAEFHAGLGVLGALLVAASTVGVPLLSAVSPAAWAVVAFAAIAASGLYRTYSQRSSLVHRLRR
ncbi:DUF7344 domain-containing protein [Halobacterium jilantaiense]|uniref:DUF7344 domain-containing protein n=1 Tax=Halobacterium jilantaiense TaxID=355548 RepID=A0A1I0PN39_9EURY|nr:hypothetical protein [Halobacterium jilantaiense]SEW15665.1 hypothetical protein SAMN04487945_1810 [Halobacterium jilantaiense]